jgi:hypothetical protein
MITRFTKKVPSYFLRGVHICPQMFGLLVSNSFNNRASPHCRPFSAFMAKTGFPEWRVEGGIARRDALP